MSEALQALGISANPPFFMNLVLLGFFMFIPLSIVGVVIARIVYSRTGNDIREKRKNTDKIDDSGETYDRLINKPHEQVTSSDFYGDNSLRS